MKKTLVLLALLLLAVVSSISTMAQNSKIYVSDFSIKKGETKTISVTLDNPDYSPSAFQFDLYFSGGIVPVEKNNRVSFSRQDRVPEDGYVGAGGWHNNGEFYRYVAYNSFGDKIEGVNGAILTFKVTTNEAFGAKNTPATIYVKNVRMSNLDNTLTSYKARETHADVFQAFDFGDLFSATNEGQLGYLSEAIHVATMWKSSEGKDFAYATNSEGQWVKLIFPNGNTSMHEGETYEGGEIGGIVTDATLNPTLTIDNPGEYELASTDITPGKQIIDLQDQQAAVELHPNEIVDITGFYFVNSEGKPCLSEWSGLNGSRGTVVEIDTEMCNGFNFAAEEQIQKQPVQYHFVQALVQRKAAAAASSPAKAAPAEVSPFDGFVILPILNPSNGTIVTAVEDIETTSAVTSVRYINIAGVESSTPFDGINIVVRTHADGSTSTSKVIK